MENRVRYIDFCNGEDKLPVFYQPWWLDTVCSKGNWDVIIYERNNKILGIYPYFLKSKFRVFHVITMPPYTPFLGPYLKYPENLRSFERIAFEKEVVDYFINEMPEFDKSIQFFHYSFSNWLPFYWHNFRQSSYYSYIIENISNIAKVKSEFHANKQQEIKKAEKIVKIKFDLTSDEFYNFHKLTLEKTGQKISYTLNFFRSLVEASLVNESGRIIYACDEEKIYSAIFFVWDKNSGYNLITANDPDHKKSGSLTLLIYETISFLCTRTNMYDLEGSMNEKLEFSYRQFGGEQKQYFSVIKTNSLILRLAESLNYILHGSGAK